MPDPFPPPLVLVRSSRPSPFSPRVTKALAFIFAELRADKPQKVNHLAELLEAMRYDALDANCDDQARALYWLEEPLGDLALDILPEIFEVKNPKNAWTSRKCNLVVTAVLAVNEAMALDGEHLREDIAIGRVLPILRRRLPDTTIKHVREWRTNLTQRQTGRPRVPKGAIRRYEQMMPRLRQLGATPRQRYSWLMMQLEEVLAPVAQT